MPEFAKFMLCDMIKELGEDRVKTILSPFVCPRNKDVEFFIQNKAIEFSKQGLAGTHLVYWVSNDKTEKHLVGYYAIANKVLFVSQDDVSKRIRQRLHRFGSYNQANKEYIIAAPLIAQLGKNYYEGNDTLIYGRELLQMALDTVKDMQKASSGKFVYLESENVKPLINFYEENGFTQFGKRAVDRDEKGVNGDFLIQWIRYLNDE